jgi:hypothetical protein
MTKNASKKSRSKGSAGAQASRSRSYAVSSARNLETALAGVSVEALARELQRRQSELPQLKAKAQALRAELAETESRIALLSGQGAVVSNRLPKISAVRAVQRTSKKPTAGRRTRGASGGPTFAERVTGFLTGRTEPSAPRDIAVAIAKQLNRDVNQSLLVQVSISLRKLVNGGAVTQVGRGQYLLKGATREA